MTTGRFVDVPAELAPVELERDLLGSAFRASMILDENPHHQPGRHALAVLRGLTRTQLCLREHGDVLDAIHACLRDGTTAHPMLVRNELRRCRRWDAMRLLPDLIRGAAPLCDAHVYAQRIRDAAAARQRYVEALDSAAEILTEAR